MTGEGHTRPPVLWEPSDEEIERTNLAAFLDQLAAGGGPRFEPRDYAALWQWSVDEVEAFSKAWSRGDAKAAASFYTVDGLRVGAAGDVQHGRLEIEAAYDRLLHGPFAGATVTQERGSVRALAADLALWQGAMEIAPAGGAPHVKGYVVQLMKKENGRWLVLEAHPKLFPPPPR